MMINAASMLHGEEKHVGCNVQVEGLLYGWVLGCGVSHNRPMDWRMQSNDPPCRQTHS